MKARTFKTLENGVCRVSIRTEDWSEADRKLMEKFSEPEIDLGGDIADGSDIVITLDTDLRRVASGSPFAAAFDIRDYDDEAAAKRAANVWQDVILARLTAAITALRLQEDGFTGETLEEI